MLEEEDTTKKEPEKETRFVEGDMKSTGKEVEQNSAQGEDPTAPGFEIIYGVACMLAVFLCKRK